jgi:hypothetical protein
MRPPRFVRRLVCQFVEHDWFPHPVEREYIPTISECLRCDARQVTMPYGSCLGGHPIQEHYDLDGREHQLDEGYCSTRWAT